MSGGKSRSGTKTGQAVQPFIEEQLLPSFAPVQQQLLGQISEGLRTGGIGAQIPFIQQAVSQARSGLSSTLQSTEDRLARTDLAGTPFGERVLAETQRQGAQQIAGIPSAMTQQFIGQAPQLTMGLLQAILGSLAAASTTKQRSGPFAL